MKIKIVKIKVQDADQEFDSSAFIMGKHTVISTHAELKEEKDGLYWHVFFTYSDFEIATAETLKKEDKALLKAFHTEVLEFVKTYSSVSLTVKNSIINSIDNLPDMRTSDDFARLRNIGKGTVTAHSLFFEELLDKIYKYSFNY